jgi:hypothetical protein
VLLNSGTVPRIRKCGKCTVLFIGYEEQHGTYAITKPSALTKID